MNMAVLTSEESGMARTSRRGTFIRSAGDLVLMNLKILPVGDDQALLRWDHHLFQFFAGTTDMRSSLTDLDRLIIYGLCCRAYHHIVGRCIPIHRDHIEGTVHTFFHGFLQHLGPDGNIVDDEAQHGRHVGMDHPSLLAIPAFDGGVAQFEIEEAFLVKYLLSNGIWRRARLGIVGQFASRSLSLYYSLSGSWIIPWRLPDPFFSLCPAIYHGFYHGFQRPGKFHFSSAGVGVAGITDNTCALPLSCVRGEIFTAWLPPGFE